MKFLVTLGFLIVCVTLGGEARLKHKNYIDRLIPQTDNKRQLASCAGNEFACHEKCIPASYVCDTDSDCSDGLDEQQNCPTDCTGHNQFKCPDKCISSFYTCDASNDCSDGSDEKNCSGSCRGSDFKVG
uniref:LNR domain-containing protein n=1 Tax=Biomphalaria glabrata TaxID=6526 RepID=A0A2C9LHS5_BIOGL